MQDYEIVKFKNANTVRVVSLYATASGLESKRLQLIHLQRSPCPHSILV